MNETIADAADSIGDIMKRLKAIEDRQDQQDTTRRLKFASVGSGGLRVHSGGNITLEGGGSLSVNDEGDILVDGGEIRAVGEDGEHVRLVNGRVQLNSGGIASQIEGRIFAGSADPSSGRVDLQLIPPHTDPIEGDNRLVVEGASSFIDGAVFAVTEGVIELLAQSTVQIHSGDAQLVLVSELDMFLLPANGVLAATIDNTTSAANMHITGTGPGGIGVILRVTSAAAAKMDIQDLVLDPAEVLLLRPRTWRDRREVDRQPDTDRWHVGLVAEEVEATGLHEFVDYDSDGQPQSVAYDRLAVALLAVLRQQQDRLNALDGGGERLTVVRDRKPPRKADPGGRAPAPPRPVYRPIIPSSIRQSPSPGGGATPDR